MRTAEFEPHVGNIVLLDLVTGMQVCTEIKSIDKDTGKVTTGKTVIFQIAVEPNDPSSPPSPNNPMAEKLKIHPYGGPFILPPTESTFDVEHVMQAHSPISRIEKAYLQATSGIEIAGADAISGLGMR